MENLGFWFKPIFEGFVVSARAHIEIVRQLDFENMCAQGMGEMQIVSHCLKSEVGLGQI